MNNNSFWDRLPIVTKSLLVINFVCWLVDVILKNRAGIMLSGVLGLNYIFSPSFHFWQPLTYMFMHANFEHIFFNMFAVLMFAPALEQQWGSRRFLLYYLVTGVGAAIVQELVWFIFYGPSAAGAVTIGASGAVFGILLAFGLLFPDTKLFIFFIPIPIRARIFVIIYAVCELFLGVASFSGDNVAHFAHLGGMLFGYLLILLWRRKDKDKSDSGAGFGGWHYQDPV